MPNFSSSHRQRSTEASRFQVSILVSPRHIVFMKLEGMGAYGPLLLAPAEELGGPLGPLTRGGGFILIIN